MLRFDEDVLRERPAIVMIQSGGNDLKSIGLLPALRRRLQRLERERQTPRRELDRIGIAHLAIRCGQSRRSPGENCATAIVYRRNLTSYRGKASTARALACA